MSLTGSIVDERVVQMKFDNADFEKNVKTSMNTLDKLKESLQFKKSNDGIDELADNLGKLGSNNGLSSLADAVDDIGDRFSAMSIIGITALTNLTNRAVDAGLQIVKSLSIDQLTAGWTKYDDKTRSVQTIMAATGKSIEEVSTQLDKLMRYTDETSYDFVDMTGSIGKFTSNGVELEEAVKAMQGISNWAAISGQTKQQASMAMYNLSQALSIGAVKVQDWKSIELANMATKEFKETAMQAAAEVGTLKTEVDAATGELKYYYETVKKSGSKTLTEKNYVTSENFRTTLTDGWFDSNTLTKTLNKYGEFSDLLINILETQSGDALASDWLDWIDAVAEGTFTQKDLEYAMGETGYKADELTTILTGLASSEYDLGRKSMRLAQEAKTFAETMDSVKDAVSSKWMTIFENIFGDYEKAKGMWTKISNDLWDIFAGSLDESAKIFKDANKVKRGLQGVLEDLGYSYDEFESKAKGAIEEVAAAMNPNIDINSMFGDYGSITEMLDSGILDTLLGDGATETVFDKALGGIKRFIDGEGDATSATYDTATELEKLRKVAQQVWNGELGDGHVRREAYTALGYYGNADKAWNDILWKYHEGQELTEADLALVLDMTKAVQDSSRETTTAYKDVKAAADAAGKSVYDYINDEEFDKYHQLPTLVSSVQTAVLNMVETIKIAVLTFRKAWENIFPKKTAYELKKYAFYFSDFTETVANLVASFSGYSREEKKFFSDMPEYEGYVSNLELVLSLLLVPLQGITQILSLVLSAGVPVLKFVSMLLSPIVDLAALIGGLLVTLTATVDVFGPIKAIISGFVLIVQTLTSVFGIFYDVLKSIVGQRIIDFFTSKFDALGKGIDGTTKSINDFVAKVVNRLNKFGEYMKTAEFAEALKNKLRSIRDWFVELEEKFEGTALGKFFAKINKFGELLGKWFGADFRAGLVKTFDESAGVSAKLSNTWSYIKETVKGFLREASPQWIKDVYHSVKDIYEGISKFASGFMNVIKHSKGFDNTVRNLSKYIKDWINTKGPVWLKNLVDYFAEVKKQAQDISKSVSNWFKGTKLYSFIDKFKSTFGSEEFKSGLVKTWTESEGIFSKISNSWSYIVDAAKVFLKASSPQWLKDVYHNAKDIYSGMSQFADGLKNVISESDGYENTVKSISKYILDWVDASGPQWMKDLVADLRTIKGWIDGIKNSITTWYKGSKLGAFITQFKSFFGSDTFKSGFVKTWTESEGYIAKISNSFTYLKDKMSEFIQMVAPDWMKSLFGWDGTESFFSGLKEDPFGWIQEKFTDLIDFFKGKIGDFKKLFGFEEITEGTVLDENGQAPKKNILSSILDGTGLDKLVKMLKTIYILRLAVNVTKVAGSFSKIFKNIGEFFEELSDVGGMIEKVKEHLGLKQTFSQKVFMMATAILEIAAAIYLIAKIDWNPKKIITTLGIIGAVFGEFILLYWGIAKLTSKYKLDEGENKFAALASGLGTGAMVLALTMLVGVIVAVFFIIDKINSGNNATKKIIELCVAMAAIFVLMAALSRFAEVIGDSDMSFGKGAGVNLLVQSLIPFILAIALIFVAVNKCVNEWNKENSNKQPMLILVAAIASVITILAFLKHLAKAIGESNFSGKAGLGMLAFTTALMPVILAIVLMAATMKKLKGDPLILGASIVGVGLLMYALASVAKVLDGVKISVKSTIAIVAFAWSLIPIILAVIAIAAVTKKLGEDKGVMVGSFVAIGLIMAELAAIAIMIGKTRMAKSGVLGSILIIAAMAASLYALSILLAAMSLISGKKLALSGGIIIALLTVVGAIVVHGSKIKFKSAAAVFTALVGIVGVLVAFAYAMGALNTVVISDGVVYALGIMGLIIVAVGVLLIRLSKIQNGSYLKSAASLLIILAGVAGALWFFAKGIKELDGVSVEEGVIWMLVVLGGIIAALGVILIRLARLEGGKQLESGAGMLATLGGIALALWQFGEAMKSFEGQDFGWFEIRMLTIFGAMIAGIGFILLKLSGIKDGKQFESGAAILESLGGLAIVLFAFGDAMQKMNGVTLSKEIEITLGIMGGIVAAICVIMLFISKRSGWDTLGAGAGILLSLVGVSIMLYMFGNSIKQLENVSLGDGVLGAIITMGVVVVALGLLLTIITGVVSKSGGMGIAAVLLSAIAIAGVLIAFGYMMGMAADAITKVVDAFQSVHFDFMNEITDNLKYMFEQFEGITIPEDEGGINPVDALGDYMFTMVSAFLGMAIADWVTSWGGDKTKLTDLNTVIIGYGEAIDTVMTSLSKWSADEEEAKKLEASIERVTNFLTKMNELNQGNFFLDWKNNDSLKTYGEAIKAFGEGIGYIGTGLSTLSVITDDQATTASSTVTTMLEALSGFNKGWIENSQLKDTAENVRTYGEGLQSISNALNTMVSLEGTFETSIDFSTVGTAISTKFNDELFTAFEAGLSVDEVKYQTAISDTISKIDTDVVSENVNTYVIGTTIANKMASDMLNGFETAFLTDETGIADKITDALNAVNKRNYSWDLSGLGDSFFEQLSQKVSGMTEDLSDSTGNVADMISGADGIIGTITKYLGADENGEGGLQGALNGIFEKLNATDMLAGFDMDSLAKGFGDDLLSSFYTYDENGEKTGSIFDNLLGDFDFSTMFEDADGNDAITSTLSSYSDDFEDAGKSYAENLSAGLTASKDSVKASGEEIANAAKEAFSNSYATWKGIGEYCVLGLANGMISSASIRRITSAAQYVSNRAVTASRQTLDEHSPSRVFRDIGTYCAEGLALGISGSSSLAENSAEKMTESVVSIATTTAEAIADAINGNTNLDPQIRPVLDLSNIREGVGAIDSLLNAGYAYGITSSIGGQNGSNLVATIDPTSVSNLSTDISNAVIQGVVSGITNAINSADGQPVNIYLDGRQIASTVNKYQRMTARALGV